MVDVCELFVNDVFVLPIYAPYAYHYMFVNGMDGIINLMDVYVVEYEINVRLYAFSYDLLY